MDRREDVNGNGRRLVEVQVGWRGDGMGVVEAILRMDGELDGPLSGHTQQLGKHDAGGVGRKLERVIRLLCSRGVEGSNRNEFAPRRIRTGHVQLRAVRERRPNQRGKCNLWSLYVNRSIPPCHRPLISKEIDIAATQGVTGHSIGQHRWAEHIEVGAGKPGTSVP